MPFSKKILSKMLLSRCKRSCSKKVILVPYQPTCENLLLDFVDRLSDKFNVSTPIFSIRLEETPTSFAEWFLEDNIPN